MSRSWLSSAGIILLAILCLPVLASLFPQAAGAQTMSPEDDYLLFLPALMRTVSTPAPTPSPTPTTPPGPTPNPGNNIVIDYRAWQQFDNIPTQYLQAAAQLRLRFWHASVGGNIDAGLDCLMNATQPRPNTCDRHTPTHLVTYNSIYNRTNWVFDFHQPPPEQNPGWWDKHNLFVNRVDALSDNTQFVGFKFGYVDGYTNTAIDNSYFARTNDGYPGIEGIEALQARNPERTVILFTMGLSRLTNSEMTSFNSQMRTYASQNGQILFDIADISSYNVLTGGRCVSNNGNGQPALCDEYTEEINAGHLNSLGQLVMAKAFWVMMARMAGWVP